MIFPKGARGMSATASYNKDKIYNVSSEVPRLSKVSQVIPLGCNIIYHCNNIACKIIGNFEFSAVLLNVNSLMHTS